MDDIKESNNRDDYRYQVNERENHNSHRRSRISAQQDSDQKKPKNHKSKIKRQRVWDKYENPHFRCNGHEPVCR